MKAYQLVSESVQLQEGTGSVIGGLAATTALLASTFGTWILNKHIRASRVMKMYPTPGSLKKKLLTSNNSTVRAAAMELNDSMTQEQYKEWVMVKTSPKMGIGKAILMLIFSNGTAQLIQLGKAAIHSGESGDTILDRAERKGRFSNI